MFWFFQLIFFIFSIKLIFQFFLLTSRKERRLPKQSLLSLLKLNHLKLRLKPLHVLKVNLTLNQIILEMLNVSSVRGLDNSDERQW